MSFVAQIVCQVRKKYFNFAQLKESTVLGGDMLTVIANRFIVYLCRLVC
uniref:Uncharacterized protein n=1 Tax=Arundo donax TaxID=35708 RepID=A0A0A9CDZ5_ARUDO